jgi:hypothetical protein
MGSEGKEEDIFERKEEMRVANEANKLKKS